MTTMTAPEPTAAATGSGDPILVLDDVNTYYGNIHALQGVSMTVGRGEIVTLLGANGAGKTTTLKTIAPDIERVFTLFPRLRERTSQQGGTLSGGEQQMLAIGRALMSEPRVLLLDEPSLGLAPILVQQVFQKIREINEQGTTVLLVEQNALQALSIAHRAYVLQTGRVVLSGPAEEIKQNESVRKAYLGEE
jgi:branched-chain amino acid transport system ATP-binding protein